MEIWDVGGTPKYASTRSVFYSRSIGGVILVYDTTSQKSQSSLERWLAEVAAARNGNQQRDEDDAPIVAVAGTGESAKPSAANSFATRQSFGNTLTGNSTSAGQLASWTLPTLLVGTKTDSAEQRQLRTAPEAARGGRWTMAAQNEDLRDTSSWSAGRSHVVRRLLQPIRAARFVDEIQLVSTIFFSIILRIIMRRVVTN